MVDPEFAAMLKKIHDEAKIFTVDEVIAQLKALPKDVRKRPFAVWDNEDGDSPYYGELVVHEQIVTITSWWTDDMNNKLVELRNERERALRARN